MPRERKFALFQICFIGLLLALMFLGALIKHDFLFKACVGGILVIAMSEGIERLLEKIWP